MDKGCRVGRNYHDYEECMERHPDTAVVRMDSVVGSKGGKVLLTFFVKVSLMLFFSPEVTGRRETKKQTQTADWK